MNKCARAIILIDNEYVFIKRVKIKNGKRVEYYATVGGHIDNDEESYEEALKREVFEELGVNCLNYEFNLELFNTDLNKLERFYNVKLDNNNFTHGNGPEFTNINFEKYGSYEVVSINRRELYKYNILPIEIKNLLIENTKNDV